MPRPKSRCRGGRVTPKGTRPGDRNGDTACGRPTPEEVLLWAATQNFGECDGVDMVERTASAMLTRFRPLPYDEEPILDAGRVLTAARTHPDRTAAAQVAAALGAYGPPGHRERARSLAARLISGGAPEPEWVGALGDVEPRRAVVMADGWDEERILWIDFARPDGEVRGIGMRVNAIEAGYACGFLYGPAIAEVWAAVEAKVGATVREIGLSDARAMAVWGLELRDMAGFGRDHDDDGDELDLGLVNDEELRALFDQRVGLLPGGGAPPFDGPLTEDEFDDLCDEFLDSRWFSVPGPGEWLDADVWLGVDETRWLAHWLVNNVCEFAEAWCDSDPLRWSPARAGMYLEQWIPERVVCHDGVHDAVEAVFPLWLRFAAERRGLADDLLEQNLAAARKSFSAMRANSADPAKRSVATNILTGLVADGVNLRDEAVVQAWIDGHNASLATSAASAA